MKILFIEDSKSDIDAFATSLELFKTKNPCVPIDYTNISSIKEFKELYPNNDYDAIVIDIKLKGSNGQENLDIDAGNHIIEKIEKTFQNIPIYIVTGTPSNIKYTGKLVVKTYTKGEGQVYGQVLDNILSLHNTGLIKIIGGKGILFQIANKIYKENILPDIEVWMNYCNKNKETEKILSRYISSCLEGYLEDSCQYVKEEMFMIPPANNDIKTGTILKSRDDLYYVVITPECDLYLRNDNKPKSPFVLLCQLQDSFDKFDPDIVCKYDHRFPYIYYIPAKRVIKYSTFLNFREIFSIKWEEAKDASKYNKVIQIQPAFAKEILIKFSNYYSRLGQPSFYDNHLKESHEEKGKEKDLH